MEKIKRRGIAFDRLQLKEFDLLIKKKGYKNRSEAIRDLIREKLIEKEQDDPECDMIATLTMVYNHHEHNVQHELTHIEHHSSDIIRSGLHVHLNGNNCLEVLILKGKVKEIKILSDKILSTKGVRHGKLVLTAVD
jgi:CopG family transcriptional regulator, nickel-responsive regulator